MLGLDENDVAYHIDSICSFDFLNDQNPIKFANMSDGSTGTVRCYQNGKT